MSKMLRLVVVVIALVAFASVTVAVAEDYYIIKDASGKMSVVDKKPADEKSVVKGPFKTKEEADKAMKGEGSAKKPTPPDQGC